MAKLSGHPPKRTASTSAKFVFSSSDSAARFRCKLDHGAFRACRSPLRLKGLRPGVHSLTVMAVDGGLESKAVVYKWTVVRSSRSN